MTSMLLWALFHAGQLAPSPSPGTGGMFTSGTVTFTTSPPAAAPQFTTGTPPPPGWQQPASSSTYPAQGPRYGHSRHVAPAPAIIVYDMRPVPAAPVRDEYLATLAVTLTGMQERVDAVGARVAAADPAVTAALGPQVERARRAVELARAAADLGRNVVAEGWPQAWVLIEQQVKDARTLLEMLEAAPLG